MNKIAAADVAIFGGGIAGLWLLDRLRQAGFSALLFESGTLGGGQTHKAQGIIHGGMKYALQGVLTNEVQAIADMPELWKQCLAGRGEVDLSHVPILSQKHYLWSPNKFTAKLAGLLASTALMSKVDALSKEHYPAVFQNAAFKGQVFALDEIVVDVPTLVRELVKANQEAVFKIEPLCGDGIMLDDQGNMTSATVYMAGKSVDIRAQQFIFTAGAGNEVIIKKLNQPSIEMQRRPLHMVLVNTPFDHALYAHCLGVGPRPRLTITTHHLQDGRAVWYLGGLLAEEGVSRDSNAQIQAARAELEALFPWLDFSAAEFATFMIDRAEPKQASGLKPDTACVSQVGNMMVAWPTKLALAPKLADDIMQRLKQAHMAPQLFDVRELRAWPMPPIARPVWEDAFCKNVI
jgi:glycerol-3-phosphate dehydrogenase